MPKVHIPYVYEFGRERETPLPGKIHVSITYNRSLRTHSTSSDGQGDVAVRRVYQSQIDLIVRSDPKYSNSTHAEICLTEEQLRACLTAIEMEKISVQSEKQRGLPAASQIIPFLKPMA